MEHISTILERVLGTLRKQADLTESVRGGGLNGSRQPDTCAVRSPLYPLAQEEDDGRRLDKVTSKSKAVSGL